MELHKIFEIAVCVAIVSVGIVIFCGFYYIERHFDKVNAEIARRSAEIKRIKKVKKVRKMLLGVERWKNKI